MGAVADLYAKNIMWLKNVSEDYVFDVRRHIALVKNIHFLIRHSNFINPKASMPRCIKFLIQLT